MSGMPFAGIVDIPLFDTAIDLTGVGAVSSFHPVSDWPLIQKAVNSAVAGVVNGLFSYVPCVNIPTDTGVLSKFIIDNAPTTINGVANYVDELITYSQGAAGGTIRCFIKPQPAEPGDWSGSPFTYYTVDPITVKSAGGTVSGGTVLNNGALCKGNYGTTPCIVGIMAPGSGVSDTFVPAPFYLGVGGLIVDNVTDFGGLNTTNDFGGTWVHGRPPTGPFQPFDNCICMMNTNTFPGVHSLLKWISLTSAFDYHAISIDDTGLPGGLAALFNTTAVEAWRDGFVTCVQTFGAGPTKQQFEVIMFDALATQWWLIRFQPQDANAAAAVNNDASSIGWSVTVDPRGILWFEPGTTFGQTHIFYSYSPLKFSIPWIYPQLLNPIVLPCYNTCNPVSYCQPQNGTTQ